jgi:thiosulfate/3-mercaptopyruvate sulfurtransferase
VTGRWCLAVLLAVAPPAAGRAQEAAGARLISTAELQAMLDHGDVPVIDAREPWVSYLQNHLPRAGWLSVETLRAQDGGLPFQLLAPAAYADLFHRLGVSPDRPVVVYSAGDQADIDATFVCWLLRSAGATRVYLLDGGYAKWDLEGRPLTQHYPRHDGPVAAFRPGDFQPAVATLAEVQAAVAGSGALLVDARPADQYAGSAGAQLRRGHIPGAVSHPWKDDLEKPDLALVWKSRERLAADYRAQGITPDRDIIIYCNSSTEASHVFFALHELLGYPRVRIYTGAWSQWAEREELPVEK